MPQHVGERPLSAIPVIDLFAGPGGLGEGFSALRVGRRRPFEVVLSIEKDEHAHSTLELRSFLPRVRADAGAAPHSMSTCAARSRETNYSTGTRPPLSGPRANRGLPSLVAKIPTP